MGALWWPILKGPLLHQEFPTWMEGTEVTEAQVSEITSSISKIVLSVVVSDSKLDLHIKGIS